MKRQARNLKPEHNSKYAIGKRKFYDLAKSRPVTLAADILLYRVE